MIVDDAESDRVSYVRYLQSDSERSYRIIEAETLEEGLQLWRSQQPDVVLLDINLPDGDGLEFLEEIGTERLINRLPVIMLTGMGDERIAVRAMKLGATDYLVKGDVTAVSLLTCIAQVQENNLLIQQLRRSQLQQTVIASMALHIRRSHTFEDVSNTIVQEIRSFLVADRVIIYRFNPDMSGEIVAESVISPWDSSLNAQIEDTCFQGNLGGEYQKGKVFAAHDIYEANLTECHIQLLERFQVKANLVAPILLNGMNTLWGLLIVHQCDAPRQWHEEDIQLLQQLSIHLAISLYQAELYQNLESLNASLEEKVQERTQEIQLQAQMLEQINDAVISTAMDGTILTWNIGSEKLYGYESHEAIGQNISMLYLTEDLPLLQSSVLIPLLEKGTHEVELRNRTKSGNTIDISLRLSLVRDEMENPIRVIGCSNDISDRKQAELELRKSESRFRQLFESDVVGTLSADLQGQITDANDLFLDMLGYTRQELESGLIRWNEITPPEYVAADFYAMSHLLEYGTITPWEKQYSRKDGSRVSVIIGAVLLTDSDDQTICIAVDISDRKRAEQKLQQLNQELETKVAERTQELAQVNSLQSAILGSTSYSIISTDLNGIIQTCNPSVERMLGYSPSELIGNTPEIIHDRQEVIDRAAELTEELKQDIPVGFEVFIAKSRRNLVNEQEWTYIRKDGSRFPVSLSVTALKDDNDQIIGFLGIANDISDRKEAEIALIESETKFRRLVEGINDLIWSTDKNGAFSYLSPQFQTLFGLEVNEWIGKKFTDLVHPDDLDGLISAYKQSIRSQQKTSNIEFRHLHQNGDYIWVSINTTPIINSEGIVIGGHGILADISDRKVTEAALRASDQRWQFALERAGDGIFDWNVQTNEIFYSKQWKGILGYADDEIENKFKSWEDLVHPDDLAQCYADVNKYLNNETQLYETEHRLRCKDGSYKWILARGGAIERGADGQVLRMMGTHTDLSDRKQAEVQLQKINEELLRATKLKDEFLANMSHELRTPLNSILGMSESLKDEILGSLNEKQLKAIGIVESSGEHLLSLINDILDLSKISSGMMELNTESVSVKNLCDSSLVFVRQQAFQKKVQLNSNIPKNINKINVEERRIRQVLINLLTNAVKFTPSEGQVNLLVAVGGGDTWQGEATIPQRIKLMNSPMIVFQIVDTGIGIAPKDLQRLFQPFVQVSSSLNRQYEGTGLGLALVKQIVELHGGQVMAESKIGKGSSFSVALPYDISQSSAPESTTVSTTLEPVVIDPDHAPLILLAEDNEANIDTFTAYLTAINYRIAIARNGEEAVAMAKSESPDIIIMDIQMPGMDGLEAIGLIRADASIAAIPIIALTALAMEGDRERCLAAGANEYLAKPVKFRQLNTVIQQILT
ncbi:PAS domain S-box protein [Planktothrix agardhii]|uniref:PAS domain S-box protein n=1 Tax=Planktothrix agardhii TaxID=1160 RepID=UPI00130E35E1|nr:PAS domain S-box protein [Planktothrix agardhii]